MSRPQQPYDDQYGHADPYYQDEYAGHAGDGHYDQQGQYDQHGQHYPEQGHQGDGYYDEQ